MPHTQMKRLEDTDARRTQDAPREMHEIFVLGAGGHLFAVSAKETDGVAEGLTPAPLPHAPAAVLGVVNVGGRMRTVLYPPALFADEDDTNARSSEDSTMNAPRFVVALRGDEQLALAADEVLGVVKVNIESLSTSGAEESPLVITLEHENRRVQLLDASRLFDAAMRGTERRRPRA
jgi:chemotaxis signal transduction protein